MKLPALSDPPRYRGLYVFDFGEWCAVGYTAEEIAALLESEQYRDGKAYRIVRATPDGQIELRGVPGTRFQLEGGMFFTRRDRAAAERDYDELVTLAEQTPPPCRAYVHLTDRGPHPERAQFVTALVYPAEHDDEMAAWLATGSYAGGDLAEGGPSHVTNYYDEQHTIVRRTQLWSQTAIPARGFDELQATARRAVQR